MIWIGTIWSFKEYSSEIAIQYLAVAIIFAFLFQCLVMLPNTISFLRKHLEWKSIFQYRFFTKEIWTMISSISIGVIGVGASQINSAIDTVFARYCDSEGPAYLNYSIHLQQLPLALFGVGISSALLPSLARSFKLNDFKKYKSLISYAISLSLLFLIPCSMAILILGYGSINLIYGRGNFNHESTLQTILCLWGYGAGLIPMGISLLLTTACYAKKNYWIPTKASLISIIINIILNVVFIFIFNYKTPSLAYASSLASVFSAYFLVNQLGKNNDHYFFGTMTVLLAKIIICTIISGLIALIMGYVIFSDPTLSIIFGKTTMPFNRIFYRQCFQFVIMSCIYFFSFITLAWLLKIKNDFSFNKNDSQFLDNNLKLISS